LGVGVRKEMQVSNYPILVEYFVQRNIKIAEIKCGGYHTIALDAGN
jgi:hypothetical protein